MEEKVEKKSISKYKYTILIIAMFIAGIFFGILFSNMNSKENKGDIKGISEERAKEIALEDAKKDFKKEPSLDTSIFVKTKKDIYEVSFYLDGIDYEYDIRVSDGVILDKDIDIPMNQNHTGSSNDQTITLEAAKEIVLKDANQEEPEITFRKKEKDSDIYEFKFYNNDVEFEYEVNSNTGNIISKKIELRNKNITNSSNEITIEEARLIALKDASLNEKDVLFPNKVSLTKEENCSFYEIKFLNGNKEYEYEIELSTGTILEKSWKIK